eukprot:gene19650-21593_t
MEKQQSAHAIIQAEKYLFTMVATAAGVIETHPVGEELGGNGKGILVESNSVKPLLHWIAKRMATGKVTTACTPYIVTVAMKEEVYEDDLSAKLHETIARYSRSSATSPDIMVTIISDDSSGSSSSSGIHITQIAPKSNSEIENFNDLKCDSMGSWRHKGSPKTLFRVERQGDGDEICVMPSSHSLIQNSLTDKNKSTKEILDNIYCELGDVVGTDNLDKLPRGPKDLYNIRYRSKKERCSTNTVDSEEGQTRLPVDGMFTLLEEQNEKRRIQRTLSLYASAKCTPTSLLSLQANDN